MERLGGREGQDPRAGTDIQDSPRAAALQDGREREQASTRGSVMAGPEGEGCLDFDCQIVRADGRAVVGAVNEETPGAHGLQTVQRGLDPVSAAERVERGRIDGVADDRSGEFADGVFVRRVREIGLEQPGAAVFRLESRNGGLGRLEEFAEEFRQRLGAALVRLEAHDAGRLVRRQAFEHAGRLASQARFGPDRERDRLRKARITATYRGISRIRRHCGTKTFR